MFTCNASYRTVTYGSDEFLDVALVADERGGCAVIFNAQVVKKVWQHFRDQGRFWISNMLVCVILGKECMIVVFHSGIVDGERNCAKREHIAANRITGSAQYKERSLQP